MTAKCSFLGGVALLLALIGLVVPANAGAARPLQLGLIDALFETGDDRSRHQWLNRAGRDAQADLVILFVNWRSIAPGARPSGFNPADPADPAYNWSRTDAAVRDATARGLRVVLNVTRAPRWAEGPNRPDWASEGTWRPRPRALRPFAQAIARRYSGGYSDASSGGALPRVSQYQAWSEPNLNSRLTPQWTKKRLVGALIYRRLLNAFYRGIKSVRKQNIVVTGGTAPYGDPRGPRSRPLAFWRRVMCLRNRKRLRRAPCPKPNGRARFNALAHHPINTSGGPFRGALHPDDISSPDMGRLRRTLRAAERRGTIRPRGRRPMWATEIWWQSKPPPADGAVPARRQARYIAESLYLTWKAGARVAVNLRIRDVGEEGGGDAFGRNQTGLYFLDGKAKPALQAFRFPFVARERGRRVELWGKAPRRGRVTIRRQRGDNWRRVTRVQAGSNRVFRKVVRMRGKPRLRATAPGGENSLVYQVR